MPIVTRQTARISRYDLRMSSSDPIARAADVLRRAKSVLFITGAGLSADSGLPTYRGVGGLYDGCATENGLAIEEVLSGPTLEARPELCWRYLTQIEAACRGARPNRAHEVIADVERTKERVWVLTQNVDGFHRVAGSKQVIEIHGNVHELVCPRCSWRRHLESFAALERIPPPCPMCGNDARPDVVLFGEALPALACGLLERELTRGFDAVFTIGTTSAFPYIAAPVLAARRAGVPTVEINPGQSEVSRAVDVAVRDRAAPALEQIWARISA
jgi:NAD-dependent deacetylase